MQFSVNLLGMASMVVLARLLTPDDFGVVALASSAYAFFVTIGQFGFDLALIQLKAPDRSHYDTAWTSNIIVGLGMTLAMALVAQPAASFFGDDRIRDVIYCLSILGLVKGLENIGIVEFRRQLAFRGEYFYFLVPKLASITVGVSAAYALRSYWGLVLGMIAGQFAGLLYSFAAQPYRPRLSLAKFSELFRFTRWVLGYRLLEFLSSNGLEIILGRLRDAFAVGVFNIAYQIALLPTTEILAPVNRALFPSFSTISDDAVRLRDAFYKVFSVTVLIALPSALGIFALSDTIVLVALGPQWAEAGPLLAVLSLMGAIGATRSLVGPLLLARGASKEMTRLLTLYVAILVPAAIALISYMGTDGIAYALLIATTASLPPYYLSAKRHVGIDTKTIFAHLWRPLSASISMALVVNHMNELMTSNVGSTAAVLFSLVAVGLSFYCSAILLLWTLARKPDGAERQLLEMSIPLFQRFRS